jgi:hypothetical protein
MDCVQNTKNLCVGLVGGGGGAVQRWQRAAVSHPSQERQRAAGKQ